MRDWVREVAEGWRESAQHWDAHGATIADMFRPISDVLLEAAAIRPGERVLDVAGGTGEPALSIAPIVGESGQVVYTDLAHGMATAARRRARERALEQLRFVECSGDALPFASGCFDVAVCRLGVMFVPSPSCAVGEMVRSVRLGGRVALAVWGTKERNPFFGIPSEAAARYIASPPDPPDAPGAWRFAEAGLLAGMLRDEGAVDVVERRFDFAIEAPLTFEEFWRVRVEMSDTLREKVETMGPERAERLAEEVRAECATFFDAGAMRFPAAAVVVTGRRMDP